MKGSRIEGLSHEAQNDAKDLLNVRGCFFFWSSVVAILALLVMFTFYDRRAVAHEQPQVEFFREDHGFDIAAVSIAEKLGRTLQVCSGGEYCVERIGLYARTYHLQRHELDSPSFTLKISQDRSSAAAMVSLNVPRTHTLERAQEMDIFRSQDEGIFSGLVLPRRRLDSYELSDYGVTRTRPTMMQAISVAADLAVALNALHTQVQGHAILHCSVNPKYVFIREISESTWQATLVNYNQALVLKLKSGDKIHDPIFTAKSEFRYCAGTDWDNWFTGKKPYSANVEWRYLGILLYRLVEAGKEREFHDVLFQHLFVYHSDDCNYYCSAERALNEARRLQGDLKEFVKWLILKHETIEHESQVLSHKVFNSLPQGPMAQANAMDTILPSEQFVDKFKSFPAAGTYPAFRSEEVTDYPLVEPGNPYFLSEGTLMTLEIFIDFTSPWCKRLFETIAHHVAPAFKQKVNFIFQTAPGANHPQAGYIHEVALALSDMGGPRRFWDFADLIFENQDAFLDSAVYYKSQDDIQRKLLLLAGRAGIDSVGNLHKHVTGKNRRKVQQELKFARRFVVNRGFCMWTPIIALNGDWLYSAGSAWEQEDWRQFFDYHLALLEDPENAGVWLQSRNPYHGSEGERMHGHSRQPLTPIGAEWPGRKPGKIELQLFLDFSDEASKTIFEMVNRDLAALYDGRVTFKFQHVIDRDNHANILMHETSWAVLEVGGSDKFFEVAGILFKEKDKFQDDVLGNKSRHEVYQDLAVLAGSVVNMFSVLDRLQVLGEGNCGNRVTDHVRFADRYACSHGVDEAPRAFLNGVAVDRSSAQWGLEEWKELLDKATQALTYADED